MKKQIILIVPRYVSVGLASIGSFLESHGYDVHTVRQDSSLIERLTGILDQRRCVAVGASAMTPNITPVSIISRSIKKLYPKIPLLIGGNHVTALPEKTLAESAFDIGVVGEGELTVLETIRKLEEDIFPTHVAGTYEKLKDGTIIGNGMRPLIHDLSILPPLNYELIDFHFAQFIRDRNIKTSRGIYLTVSRGCPYSCAFCSSELTWKRKLRFWPMEYIMDGIDFLVEKYHLDSISFLDDNLTTDKEFITSFCEELIKRKLHRRIIWECQGRVDSVESEILEMLKEAGCRLIRFGMESGSDKILRFLKNNTITVQDSYNAVKLCNKHRIHCFGSFVVGSPDETLEDIMKTINLIEKSGLNSAACYSLVPYPGTRLYKICSDENLWKENISWSDFIIEWYALENIPPFVMRSHHFSSDQLYHIARYIDQNVVSRLNFGISLGKTNHRKNLERVIAGEIKLANPAFKIRLFGKKDIAKAWINQKKDLTKRIAAHPHPIRFILTKAASRFHSVL